LKKSPDRSGPLPSVHIVCAICNEDSVHVHNVSSVAIAVGFAVRIYGWSVGQTPGAAVCKSCADARVQDDPD
jgi:hypothetical protein